MNTTRTITGLTAILVAQRLGLPLRKRADPTEGARDGLTADEARAICRQDPSLIYVDSTEVAAAVSDDEIDGLRAASGSCGDLEMVAICDGALLRGTIMRDRYRVECVRALAEGWAQES